MPNKVITRMPPSPTGPFHIGSVRTALYNFLYAKQHNGKFILRIEDTDKKRSKKEFEENIIYAIKKCEDEIIVFGRDNIYVCSVDSPIRVLMPLRNNSNFANLTLSNNPGNYISRGTQVL